MEAGKRRLAGDTARAATTGEVQDLRREAPVVVLALEQLAHDERAILADLARWRRREIEAALHSVRIAHDRMIRPTEWRAIDGVISIQ